MAAGTILAVLTNIPWGTVVESAPKIADGAAKLWNSVARWNKSETVDDRQVDVPQQKPQSEIELLRTRVHVTEENVRHLNDQMQASSTLIKDLAEQNTLLIQRIELNRVRLIKLSIITSALVAVLLGFNVYLFLTL